MNITIDQFKSLPESIRKEFESLSLRLSPENLACDGELPRSEVKRRYASIMRQWHILEREVGYTVDVGLAETVACGL